MRIKMDRKFKYNLGFYRFPGSQLVRLIRQVECTRIHIERLAIFLDVLLKDSKHVPEGSQIGYEYVNPEDGRKKG